MNSNYWDEIYKKKGEQDVSWFQEVPKKSLEMISEFNLSLNARMIDIGGGDSRLVDNLIDKGYKNITVLDISETALNKAKKRLEGKADKVEFIVSDVTLFKPQEKFDLWHDRATFHFLTNLDQVEEYLKIAYESLNIGGYLRVSTFSKNGPEKCSGLTISQYSSEDLKKLFGRYFSNTKCLEDTHVTPWGIEQSFVYCGFKKEH